MLESGFVGACGFSVAIILVYCWLSGVSFGFMCLVLYWLISCFGVYLICFDFCVGLWICFVLDCVLFWFCGCDYFVDLDGMICCVANYGVLVVYCFFVFICCLFCLLFMVTSCFAYCLFDCDLRRFVACLVICLLLIVLIFFLWFLLKCFLCVWFCVGVLLLLGFVFVCFACYFDVCCVG